MKKALESDKIYIHYMSISVLLPSPLFRFPRNGHYLLLLSKCDNHHAKAALLQRPQEMEIQSLSALCVFVCECVRTQPISLSDELLSACRRAEAESAPPIPQMQL